MLVSVLPDAAVLSSVAGAGAGAVDHVLDGQISGRPGGFALDVDAIWWEERGKDGCFLTGKEKRGERRRRGGGAGRTCHGAGAAVSPAGAAVLGDVLVAGGADVVDAVDVSPVPGFGQIGNVEILVRTRSGPVKDQMIIATETC